MLNPLANLLAPLKGARLNVGISAHSIALSHQRSSWDNQPVLLGTALRSPGQNDIGIHTLLSRSPYQRLPLNVVAGSSFGLLFMVEPPTHVDRQSVLSAAAALRFQALYGQSLAEWHIEADWHAEHTFLACAYPKALLAEIYAASSMNHCPLIGVTPYFVTMLNRWRQQIRPGNWFGTVHDEILTIGMPGATNSAYLQAIRNVSIPENGHRRDWVEDQVKRTALQYGLIMPQQLQVAGMVPPEWTSPPSNGLVAKLDSVIPGENLSRLDGTLSAVQLVVERADA